MKSDALKEFDLALEYDPDFLPAYNELGIIALDEGRYEDALEQLQKAVTLDSTYATAYYNMGGVLANMGEYNHAARAYENYLSHSEAPDDSLEIRSKIRILSQRE